MNASDPGIQEAIVSDKWLDYVFVLSIAVALFGALFAALAVGCGRLDGCSSNARRLESSQAAPAPASASVQAKPAAKRHDPSADALASPLNPANPAGAIGIAVLMSGQ
jgi:hypothetical protein